MTPREPVEVRRKRIREHIGTLADGVGEHDPLILRVIGNRPMYRPYLVIRECGELGRVHATVESANALRGLARAILRALGEEPPTPTKAKVKK